MSGNKKTERKRSGHVLKGAGPGRPPGVKNKIPGQLKEMILEALSDAGGVAYLTKQADKNPNAFLALVGKVLPMTIAGDPNNPVAVNVRVELVASKHTDT